MILKNARENKISGFGLWGKNEYSSWQDEQMSWKENCYIGDWSWLAEVRVKGPDAEKFFSGLCVNSFANFKVGKCKHAIFCNSDGKIVGEGILKKHGIEDFEWQGGYVSEFASPPVQWLNYHFETGNYNAIMEQPNNLFKFQISGPKAIYVMEKACECELRDIPFMEMRNARIDGLDVQLIRQGMAGEIGFEVQGPIECHDRFQQYILTIGKEYGMRILGSRTAMINHLEASFPTIGCDYTPAVYDENERDFLQFANPGLSSEDLYDSDKNSFALLSKIGGSFEADEISAWYRSPVELNWTKNINFDHEFIGRKALEHEVENPKRTMVTLEWNAEDIMDIYASYYRDEQPYDFMDVPQRFPFCFSVDKVLDGDTLIGLSSSRGYSIFFKRTLSHCVIDLDYALPGTEVTVEWGEPGHPKKMIRAIVAPSPYKKDNRKIDLKSL